MKRPTIHDLIAQGHARLVRQSSSAWLDAELLLMHTLHVSREYCIAHAKTPVSPAHAKRFFELLRRRVAGVPVAYLTGEKEFFGRPFLVTPSVLVPRPETETLVETALSAAQQKSVQTIADIGTGSGCIAVTLACELPGKHILATDTSRRALAIAKKNAVRHHTKNVRFLAGDLLEPLGKKRVDLAVANLPYGTPSWLTDPSLKHEPRTALVGGGARGEKTIALFLHAWAERTPAISRLFLEIDPRLWRPIARLVKSLASRARVTPLRDLAGRIRIVKIIRPR